MGDLESGYMRWGRKAKVLSFHHNRAYHLSCIGAWFFTANNGAYNICLLFAWIIDNSSKSMLSCQIYSWHGRLVSLLPGSYHLGIDVEHKKPKSDYVGQTPKSNVLILSSTKCWCISPFPLANPKMYANKTSHHVCSLFFLYSFVFVCLFLCLGVCITEAQLHTLLINSSSSSSLDF